jgi:hypothetical protein
VVYCWFFVVKMWWIAGESVVFGWWFLGAEKMSLFENNSVENVGDEKTKGKDKCGGSLHCATDDKTVRGFGRDDASVVSRDDAAAVSRDDASVVSRDDAAVVGREDCSC